MWLIATLIETDVTLLISTINIYSSAPDAVLQFQRTVAIIIIIIDEASYIGVVWWKITSISVRKTSTLFWIMWNLDSAQRSQLRSIMLTRSSKPYEYFNSYLYVLFNAQTSSCYHEKLRDTLSTRHLLSRSKKKHRGDAGGIWNCPSLLI